MADEAARRPRGALRAEAVFAAIEAAGIAVGRRQQYLARVVGAAYCHGGNTPSRIAVAVCEFDTPEAAGVGRSLILAQSRAVHREVVRIGRSTVALSWLREAPSLPDERRKLRAILARLGADAAAVRGDPVR